MLAEKINDTPEVYLLRVPFQNIVTTETNVYVIRDKGDVLIVDMGAPTQEAASYFLQATRELGIDATKARYFFTHLHYDHSGLADMLLPANARLYIHKDELPAADLLYDKRVGDYACKRLIAEGMPRAKAEDLTMKIEIACPPSSKSNNIHVTYSGDFVRVGDFKFEVVPLPGHTAGMAGLYNEKTGIMFSGDQLLFDITPTTLISLDDKDTLGQYIKSMRRLLDLQPKRLFHSHGEIRSDYRRRAIRILNSRKARIDLAAKSIWQRCAEGGQAPTGIEVINSLSWKIPYPSIDDAPEEQQWLIYSQGVTVLDHLVAIGRVERIIEPSIPAALKDLVAPGDLAISDEFAASGFDLASKSNSAPEFDPAAGTFPISTTSDAHAAQVDPTPIAQAAILHRYRPVH
jgi:glyoxylase-like metal-dependent hydrolase (beta-lactamase superfamily II)